MTVWKMPSNAELRKVPTTSVFYGDAITHKDFVWAVLVDGKVVAAGATKAEAREKYRRIHDGVYGRPPAPLPSELDGRRDKPRPLRPDEEP